jgi:hypothetical protein
MKALSRILAPLFLVISLSTVKGQVWSRVGAKGASDGVIFTLNAIKGNLYAGGGFDSIGGMSYKHLSKWTGTKWESMHTEDFDCCIYTVGEFNNRIYGAGSVDQYRKAADWDGVKWDTIGKGIGIGGGYVYSSAVYKGELYLGGSFYEMENGTPVNRIARWDGTSWKDVGGGIEGGLPKVWAMTVYNGELIVGGNFNYAGGQPDYFYIAAWDGTSWKKLATGPDGQVTGLTVDTVKNVLYATGLFDWADTVYSPRVAKWDGTRWHAMPGGEIIKGGSAVCMYHGEVYLAGQGTPGFQPDTVLARWDEDSAKWFPVMGPDQMVNALAVYKDTLYVGGWFTNVNGDSSMSRIAKYWAPKKPISVQEVKNKESEIKVFPNPFSNSVVFKLLKARPKAVLALFDRSGKRQEINYSLENENTQILLQRGKLAKGIYFYRISDPQTLLGEGKLLIE